MAFDDLDEAETERASTADADTDADAPAADAGTADTVGVTAAETGGSAGGDRSESTVDVENAGGSGTDSRAGSRETSSAGDGSTEDSGGPPNDPAFGFEEAKQRPLYARQGAWDVFEDALAIEVETTLRRNDVRDAPKRELHDAALRVLADHADEVAERVLDERGVER